MVGYQDFVDDYERVQALWCKFMFPFKPPSNGLYPYYPSCVVRNYTDTFFCFDAKNASVSINTFVTAVWDNEYNWYQYRPGGYNTINGDDLQPYKCCKTPKGYYIDYVSCYYIPTHDQNFEFYDAANLIIVGCATGYVVTGISKKLDAYNAEYHVEWLQCCRVGYGAQTAVSPPIVYGKNGTPTIYAQSRIDPPQVPESYMHQYRAKREISHPNMTNLLDYSFHDMTSTRYKDDPLPANLAKQKIVVDRGSQHHVSTAYSDVAAFL
jgi:hypothetical protein